MSDDAPRAGGFDGRTAIVTGASRGIGLAIAQRLVADGARVVVTGRKQPALDQAIEHRLELFRRAGIAHTLAISVPTVAPCSSSCTRRPG